MKEKCRNCSEEKRCQDDTASWIFFVIGLIATLAMRMVTLLMHWGEIYGKIAWYIGLVGFFLFFIYKYYINRDRAKLILQHDLMNKVNAGRKLSKEETKLIGSLFCALTSDKENQLFFLFSLFRP